MIWIVQCNGTWATSFKEFRANREQCRCHCCQFSLDSEDYSAKEFSDKLAVKMNELPLMKMLRASK